MANRMQKELINNKTITVIHPPLLLLIIATVHDHAVKRWRLAKGTFRAIKKCAIDLPTIPIATRRPQFRIVTVFLSDFASKAILTSVS